MIRKEAAFSRRLILNILMTANIGEDNGANSQWDYQLVHSFWKTGSIQLKLNILYYSMTQQFKLWLDLNINDCLFPLKACTKAYITLKHS